MATGPNEPIVERVSKLASDAWAAQARMLRESVDAGRQAWAADTDPTAFGRAWLDTMSTQGQRYWRELAAMGIEVARDLLELNTRTSAAVVRSLSEAAGARAAASGRPGPHQPAAPSATGSAEPSEPAPEHRSAVVTLTGPAGATARGSLTVVNRHPRARRIEVSATALHDAVGGQSCAGTVDVDPARVTVPPGQERRIELSTVLDPQVYTPGRAYTGTIQVSGGDEATVGVIVSASQS